MPPGAVVQVTDAYVITASYDSPLTCADAVQAANLMEADAANTVARMTVKAYDKGTGLPCAGGRRLSTAESRHRRRLNSGSTFVFETIVLSTSLAAEQERDDAQSYLQNVAAKVDSNYAGMLDLFPSLNTAPESVRAITISSASAVQVTRSQVTLVLSAPSPPPPLTLSPSPALPEATEEAIEAQDGFAVGPVVGGAVGGCLLMALAAGAYVWVKRRKQHPPSQPSATGKAPATTDVTLTSGTSKGETI